MDRERSRATVAWRFQCKGASNLIILLRRTRCYGTCTVHTEMGVAWVTSVSHGLSPGPAARRLEYLASAGSGGRVLT